MPTLLNVHSRSSKIVHVLPVPDDAVILPKTLTFRCGQTMKSRNLPRPEGVIYSNNRKRQCPRCKYQRGEFKKIQKAMITSLNAWYARQTQLRLMWRSRMRRHHRAVYKVRMLAKRVLGEKVVTPIATLFNVKFKELPGNTGWACSEVVKIDGMPIRLQWTVKVDAHLYGIPNDGTSSEWADVYLAKESADVD